MKKLMYLVLVLIMISCQQEPEMSKRTLDKDQLKTVLATNSDFQRLPEAFNGYRENINALTLTITENEYKALNEVLADYEHTNTFNVSEQTSVVLSRFEIETEYSRLKHNITSELKKSYIFDELELQELFLDKVSSIANAKANEVTCDQVARHVGVSTFSNCMVDGRSLGSCLDASDLAWAYSYVGCIIKELGYLPHY